MGHDHGWQFAKVYADMADADGNPTEAYFRWATDGWNSPRPQRYPHGKGARPLYSLWGNERLGYDAARRRIYWPMYRDAVRKTAAFAQLKRLAIQGPVFLFDFDGYPVSVAEAIRNLSRPLGHGFVLKAMLEFGENVTPEQVEAAAPAPRVRTGFLAR